MSVRGARVLLVGACSERGRRLVEGLLALGAHVIAADRLRTRLEELRAEMRQHERLWVAESDALDPQSMATLCADVAHDDPIDAALLLLDAGPGPPARTSAAAASVFEGFVAAALRHMGDRGRGRVLLLVEPEPDALGAALSRPCTRAAEQARAHGLSIAGTSAPLGVAQVLRWIDPAQPAPEGWLDNPAHE